MCMARGFRVYSYVENNKRSEKSFHGACVCVEKKNELKRYLLIFISQKRVKSGLVMVALQMHVKHQRLN